MDLALMGQQLGEVNGGEERRPAGPGDADNIRCSGIVAAGLSPIPQDAAGPARSRLSPTLSGDHSSLELVLRGVGKDIAERSTALQLHGFFLTRVGRAECGGGQYATRIAPLPARDARLDVKPRHTLNSPAGTKPGERRA